MKKSQALKILGIKPEQSIIDFKPKYEQKIREMNQRIKSTKGKATKDILQQKMEEYKDAYSALLHEENLSSNKKQTTKHTVIKYLLSLTAILLLAALLFFLYSQDDLEKYKRALKQPKAPDIYQSENTTTKTGDQSTDESEPHDKAHETTKPSEKKEEEWKASEIEKSDEPVKTTTKEKEEPSPDVNFPDPLSKSEIKLKEIEHNLLIAKSHIDIAKWSEARKHINEVLLLEPNNSKAQELSQLMLEKEKKESHKILESNIENAIANKYFEKAESLIQELKKQDEKNPNIVWYEHLLKKEKPSENLTLNIPQRPEVSPRESVSPEIQQAEPTPPLVESVDETSEVFLREKIDSLLQKNDMEGVKERLNQLKIHDPNNPYITKYELIIEEKLYSKKIDAQLADQSNTNTTLHKKKENEQEPDTHNIIAPPQITDLSPDIIRKKPQAIKEHDIASNKNTKATKQIQDYIPGDPAPKTIRVPQDYTSLSMAIEMARSEDTIIISSGNYHSPIMLDKKINLLGNNEDNQKPLIRMNQNGPAITITSKAKGSKISSLVISGKKNNADLTHPAILSEAEDISITSCLIENASGEAISINSSGKTIIKNCIIKGSGKSGIISNTSQANLDIISCQISENLGNGIELLHPGQAKIQSSRASKNMLSGIYADNPILQLSLSSNSVYSNYEAGILVKNAEIAHISGNICRDNQLSGIIVRGKETETTIIDNTSIDNWESGVLIQLGVKVSKLKNNNISGNRIRQLWKNANIEK